MKKVLSPCSMPSCCGTAEVGVKGQVVIPVKLRKELGIKPRDSLVFMVHPIKGVMTVIKMEAVLAMSSKIKEIDYSISQLINKNNKQTHGNIF